MSKLDLYKAIAKLEGIDVREGTQDTYLLKYEDDIITGMYFPDTFNLMVKYGVCIANNMEQGGTIIATIFKNTIFKNTIFKEEEIYEVEGSDPEAVVLETIIKAFVENKT